MSYKNLEIWQEARELSILIHELSIVLPKFEQFEEAQQIRRSMKSVRSNIYQSPPIFRRCHQKAGRKASRQSE